jgi:type I restriction-modification system DNA methylase subunit
MGIEGLYDCVITNIPFSQNIDLNTSAYYYDGLAKKSGDGVCILHCFKSLRKGGRMTLIVPEGVLFKKTLSSIRKFLLENARLETVISLPQGVFLPYTGVKTSILYFTGCHENSSKEGVWFYEIKNDGFSLNNHRRPIELNDLKYIDYVDFSNNKSLHNDIPLTTNSLGESLGFQKVEYENIKQNDYNLIFNRYSQACAARLQSVGKKGWEMVRLGDVVDLLRGPFGSSIKREVCVKSGYKVYEQGNVINNDFAIGKYYIDDNRFKLLEKFEIQENDILLTCAGTLGKVAIVPKIIEKGIINSVLMRLRIKDSTILRVKYFLYLLQSRYIQGELIKKSTGVGLKNMRAGKEIRDLQIPLPPLETQQKIVEELDNIQKGINCLNEAIDSLKKQLNLDSFRFAHYFDGDECKIVRLGDVVTYEQPTNYIVKNTDYDNIPSINNTPVLTAGKSFILGYTKEKIGIFAKKLPVIIFDDFTTDSKYINFPFKAKSSAMKILKNTDESICDIKYIFYTMQKIKFSHSVHKRYWISEYSDLQIPLPPLETQEKILNELETIEEEIKQIEGIIEQQKERFERVLNLLTSLTFL